MCLETCEIFRGLEDINRQNAEKRLLFFVVGSKVVLIQRGLYPDRWGAEVHSLPGRQGHTAPGFDWVSSPEVRSSKSD